MVRKRKIKLKISKADTVQTTGKAEASGGNSGKITFFLTWLSMAQEGRAFTGQIVTVTVTVEQKSN